MSEYQYYDFYAIDRPLTEPECKIISRLSSRSIVTHNQAIFNYSYGDFPDDPEEVLADYFDMMLYTTNWGTKQLLFRLPQELVDPKKLDPYCVPDIISYSTRNSYIILNLCFADEEGGGWVEGEGMLNRLLPIRSDLLKGDFRSLYLAWLAALRLSDSDDAKLEPPVPPNLKQLSSSLDYFIKFLELDNDLLKVASCASIETDTTLMESEKWIIKLPEAERNAFLARLLKGELNLDIKLNKRLEALFFQNSTPSPQQKLRLSSDLLDEADKLYQDRQQKKKKAAKKARIKKLTTLADQEPLLWKSVIELIRSKTSKGYDEAVKHLVTLKDLARYLQQTDQFSEKVEQIHKEFRRLSSFIARLHEKKII